MTKSHSESFCWERSLCMLCTVDQVSRYIKFFLNYLFIPRCELSAATASGSATALQCCHVSKVGSHGRMYVLVRFNMFSIEYLFRFCRLYITMVTCAFFIFIFFFSINHFGFI